MKVIAVITAALLPGKFVAVSHFSMATSFANSTARIVFTVPMFDWGDEVVGVVKPWALRLYWKITGPITGILVTGFVIWFFMLWTCGREAHARQREKDRIEEEDRKKGKNIRDTSNAAAAVKEDRLFHQRLNPARRIGGDEEEARL